jgi:exodeoxyribonuclease VII small subunit
MAFQDKFDEFQALVDQLEKGKLTLEESLLVYERAVLIGREAEELLKQGEMKIEVLTQDGKVGKLGKEGKS